MRLIKRPRLHYTYTGSLTTTHLQEQTARILLQQNITIEVITCSNVLLLYRSQTCQGQQSGQYPQCPQHHCKCCQRLQSSEEIKPQIIVRLTFVTPLFVKLLLRQRTWNSLDCLSLDGIATVMEYFGYGHPGRGEVKTGGVSVCGREPEEHSVEGLCQLSVVCKPQPRNIFQVKSCEMSAGPWSTGADVHNISNGFNLTVDASIATVPTKVSFCDRWWCNRLITHGCQVNHFSNNSAWDCLMCYFVSGDMCVSAEYNIHKTT